MAPAQPASVGSIYQTAGGLSLFRDDRAAQIGLNGAWLDAEYDSYADAPCSAVQLDADPFCGQVGGTTNNDLAGENTILGATPVVLSDSDLHLGVWDAGIDNAESTETSIYNAIGLDGVRALVDFMKRFEAANG